MWLCTKHVDWYQQNNRITILGTDDLTSAEVMESEDDRQLVENIQELLGKCKNSWFHALIPKRAVHRVTLEIILTCRTQLLLRLRH